MDWSSQLSTRRRFLVHAKPNARRTEILSYHARGDFFTVAVAAQPLDGKANDALETYFSKLLKKRVVLKSGQTSKKKLFDVIP